MINRIIILFLFLSVSLYAQNLLSKIQDKFNSTNAFKSGFTQTTNIAGSEGSMELSGEFYFKKENNYRIDLSSRSIISDGESIWNYDKTNNKVVILAVEDDPLSFSLSNFILDYPEFCEIEELSDTSLLLTPDPDELELESIKIWCDDNYIVNKIEITDFNGAAYTFVLKSVKFEDISDSLFTFTPIKGTQVIDLR